MNENLLQELKTGCNEDSGRGSRPVRGRKPAQESRATEFRQKLMEWKQTPQSSRPSLRALARELGTSHQLLSFHLKHLDKWQAKEYWRQAREIRARANAAGRPLTRWEEQQAHAYDRAAFRVTIASMLRDDIKGMKKESERRPLCWQEIKSLKMFARHFPEAQELLRTSSQEGRKKRKRSAEIVKETPRQEGETFNAWVRRIWDQCSKYDTKCPAVITEEHLQKCSQRSFKSQKKNLPVISAGAAKSFRHEKA
jgi:hypothetical protein